MDNCKNPFNPSEHLANIGTDKKPRMYLEVKYRLVWLREEHPEAQITTEILQLDLDREVQAEVFEWDDNLKKSVKVIKHSKGMVIFKATIKLPNGAVGTGTKMENAAAFGDWLEKAETGAIGRALASLGYGTAATDEMSEGEGHIVDAPIDRKAPAPAQKKKGPSKFDPEGPATLQQLQSVKNLQKLLGMESTDLDGLPFSDVANLIKELNIRLQEQKKNAL